MLRQTTLKSVCYYKIKIKMTEGGRYAGKSSRQSGREWGIILIKSPVKLPNKFKNLQTSLFKCSKSTIKVWQGHHMEWAPPFSEHSTVHALAPPVQDPHNFYKEVLLAQFQVQSAPTLTLLKSGGHRIVLLDNVYARVMYTCIIHTVHLYA